MHIFDPQVSLTDLDGTNQFNPYDNETKQQQALKFKKKLSEFYTAPITKFWADSVRFLIHMYKNWL